MSDAHNPLLVDEFEPSEVEQMLAQSVQVIRTPLNRSGYADYLWIDSQAVVNHWERKQVSEILSDFDGVELQLRNELLAYPKAVLGLIVEGLAVPSPLGVDFYKQSEHKPYFVLSHRFGGSKRPQPGLYAKYQAWLHQLTMKGILVKEVPTLETLATTLVTIYNNTQKPEHRTLDRYLRDRVVPKQLNPHVTSLMGVEGAGLGEAKATALIEKQGTFWKVVSADKKDLIMEGFALGSVDKLWKSIGRDK